MRIDYEISEQDFLKAQDLAVKNSPVRFVRWTRWVLPVLSLVFLAFLMQALWKQGFSTRVLPAFIIPAMFLSLPLLNRRAQKKLYARSTSMHGKLSLDATDAHLHFQGNSFDSKVNWSNFNSVLEDNTSFVIYQNSNCFNIIPKAHLTAEQVKNLSDLLRQNVKKKTSG